MSDLKFIINKARKYYFEDWRGNEEICPAFKEKVFLTNVGWRHIAKHPRRNLVDKIIRLKKLSLARDLLKTSTTFQTLKKKSQFYYWGFQSIKGDTRIKVVVSAKGKDGKKILYSVMFKNIKRSEQRSIEIHNRKIIREFKRKNYYKRKRKKK